MNCTDFSDSIGGIYMNNRKQNIKMTAALGIFTAIVVVLQLLSYVVKVGPFNLSLVLIPIVVAGVLYGPKYGAYLGAAFGIITVIGCISGLDVGGNILFNASPLLTILVCIVKAVLCGLFSGLVAKAFKEQNFISVLLSAITAPLVNTSVFVAMMFLFFKDILYSWANGSDIVSYVITGLVGINFIIELSLNIVLSPIILRIIKAVGNKEKN